MLSTLATQAWAEEIEEQIDIAQSYLLDNFDQRPTTRIQCCKVIKIQRRPKTYLYIKNGGCTNEHDGLTMFNQ